MVTKLIPEINKVYLIDQYSLFQILEGSGAIQVDFKNYFNWEDKLIYLEKGQYIKFLSDDFVIRKIEFDESRLFNNKEVRVLFKHLVALGYINFAECEDCQRYLSQTVFSEKASDIIDISSKQWFWQNPFHASKDEYHIIFDAKDIIDEQFQNQLSNQDLSMLINKQGYDAQALYKDKVGLSVKRMLSNKRLLESKKEIAFTDKNIQEISWEMGFQDPAYFNRVFKKAEGKSPKQFRRDFDFELRDQFTQDLMALLQSYHLEERSLDFYAHKMHLSVKALSKKVKNKLNLSLGQLIRFELIQSAKKMLREENKIKAIAYRLGFEEANHFSSFFKHHTGITPSQYQNKKSRY